MMSKATLLQARAKMMAALDTTFKGDLDREVCRAALWEGFRAIEEFLAGVDAPAMTNGGADESAPTRMRRGSYADLGMEAIQQAGKPLSTKEIVALVATRRNRTPDDIKPNVQAALSRDNRLNSVTWSGGRGWWLKGREVPA